jgi:hypothetical protein
MTDRQFEIHYDTLSDGDLLRWIAGRIEGVSLKNGERYFISTSDDFKAMIEQELCQLLTGRE